MSIESEMSILLMSGKADKHFFFLHPNVAFMSNICPRFNSISLDVWNPTVIGNKRNLKEASPLLMSPRAYGAEKMQKL